jgi:H+/Cl- antiporter ClcA
MASKTHSGTAGLPVAPSMAPTLESQPVSAPVQLNVRFFLISALSIFIGAMTGLIGKGLVMLITLITNISFYGHFNLGESSPAENHLGWWVVAVPVIGGLIVGIMARYGSKAIRGHGIPEAMEQILTNNSRIPPKITFLKPLSSAIAIGTGGPFGAEGPIIATGGALGSFIGQILRTTADERKVLLTAGAAAGMSAIFGSPVAAIMLAIELLLFEFSARSLIPVALAVITGAALHIALFGGQAFFAMPNVAAPTSTAVAIYSLIGLIIGIVSVGVTKVTYAIEDAFEHIPTPWMLHPMIGAIAVGVVGYFAPLTLGVGYSNISYALSGNVAINMLLVLCLLKFISWAIALGSGTSGGTLAPLFTIGGSAGALLGMGLIAILPHAGIDIRIAALVGMAAMFAGASRALLTSIIFALETTLQSHAFLPLLAGCTAAYIISYLLMKHNIMTEKIARRGVTIPGEYKPNFAENTLVRQIINSQPVSLTEDMTVEQAAAVLGQPGRKNSQKYYPVLNKEGALSGIISKLALHTTAADVLISTLAKPAVTVYDDTTVHLAIQKFTDFDISALVTLDPVTHKISGVLTHKDVLKGYRNFELKRLTPERTLRWGRSVKA